MSLSENVSYLKGLADGLELGDGKQDKIIKAIIDVLDDLAVTVDDLDECYNELCEQVDEIDEDLSELEDEVYDADADDDDEFDFAGDDDGDGFGIAGDEDEDFDDDDDYFEVECPACKETICINAELLENEDTVSCPNCQTELEFDFSCDCGHDHCGESCEGHKHEDTCCGDTADGTVDGDITDHE